MLRLPIQVARSMTQGVHRARISSLGHAVSSANRATSSWNAHIRQNVVQTPVPGPPNTQSPVPRGSDRQSAASDASRTAQLVWLAKFSLSGSVIRRTHGGKMETRKKDMLNDDERGLDKHGVQCCEKTWDGPTVWAHLW